MNQQLNVIIIDNSELRKQGMVKAFSKLSNVYVYNFKEQHIEQESPNEPGYWEAAESLIVVDLMLIHPRDREFKDIVKAKKRIWYGGNGADDTGVHENEPVIRRPIIEKDSCLNNKEAEQLRDFAFGKIDCPPFCSRYSQKEKLFDQRQNFLEKIQVPSEYDWNTPPPKGLFIGFEKEWEQLKTDVIQLLNNDSNLSPLDEKFLHLLKRFIQNTIEKDF